MSLIKMRSVLRVTVRRWRGLLLSFFYCGRQVLLRTPRRGATAVASSPDENQFAKYNARVSPCAAA